MIRKRGRVPSGRARGCVWLRYAQRKVCPNRFSPFSLSLPNLGGEGGPRFSLTLYGVELGGSERGGVVGWNTSGKKTCSIPSKETYRLSMETYRLGKEIKEICRLWQETCMLAEQKHADGARKPANWVGKPANWVGKPANWFFNCQILFHTCHSLKTR